jgi:hypothetical protein
MDAEKQTNTELPTTVSIRDREVIHRLAEIANARDLSFCEAAERMILERWTELHTGQFIPGPALEPETA